MSLRLVRSLLLTMAALSVVGVPSHASGTEALLLSCMDYRLVDDVEREKKPELEVELFLMALDGEVVAVDSSPQ
ncbi:MAG TPA: hypothetical protein VMT00_04690 [Thermoanaerobaculia bacterium]|nr:hypothetical protein [Thermoanaerobaculia bacterium]